MFGRVRPVLAVALSVALAVAVAPAARAAYADEAKPTGSHVVTDGETLSQIAAEAGVDVAAVVKLNGLTDADVLSIGQTLKLPGRAGVAAGPPTPPVAAAVAGPKTYTVTDGDTLWNIAQQFSTTTAALVEANKLDDADHVAAGSLLVVSGAAPSAAASAGSTSSANATASSAASGSASPAPTTDSTAAFSAPTAGSGSTASTRGSIATDSTAAFSAPPAGSGSTASTRGSIATDSTAAFSAPPAGSGSTASTKGSTGTDSTAASTAPTAAADGNGKRSLWVTYTVQPGETLSQIARQLQVKADAIAQASGLDDPNRISTGSVLKVPVTGHEHVVQAGDTLRDIALAEKVDLGSLIDFNTLDEPALIRVGQVILVPTAPAVTPPATPGQTAAAAMTPPVTPPAAVAPSMTPPVTPAPAAVTPPSTLAPAAVTPPVTPPAAVTPAVTPPATPPASVTPPVTPAVAAAAPAAVAANLAAGSSAPVAGGSAPNSTANGGPAKPPAATRGAPQVPPQKLVAAPKWAPTDGLAGSGLKLLGASYVWGGSSPGGFDCSGLVWYVARQVGKPLSRGMFGQYNSGSHPSRDDLKPGDLVFFQNTYSPGLSHNGIYIGNNQFVHAADETAGVTISSLTTAYWSSHWFGATRLP